MSNADWWAKQLGAQAPAPVQRSADVPMPATQIPMTPYVPPQQRPLPSTRAQSASQTTACPECNGNNYMAVQNAAPRCYDCGYPITQSGSRYGSLTGANVEGPTKSSIGNDAQSNWNPTTIVGRIDG